MNSLTYLTRRCPRKCEYCDIRNTSIKKELSPKEWAEAFDILKKLGVQFNLILGNESWILQDDLLFIMNQNEIPFAMYTTCPPNLFLSYHKKFFEGPIDNLSCAIDYSMDFLNLNFNPADDMQAKTLDGWSGLIYTRGKYPKIDCQGTITMSKLNLMDVPKIVKELSSYGIFVGINYIHWNKDGNYDFFPEKKYLERFVFSEKDIPIIKDVIEQVKSIEGSLLQNVEILDFDIRETINMNWHCKGDPYGGPTIDADGSLRLCGYRKGKYVSKMTIWDLPKFYAAWKTMMKADAKNCPGCSWSYPRMYAYWRDNDPTFGRKVFVSHAGKHIDENKWSERKIK